ncbi:MAG: NIL domain-containing protein [Verrucomicrobiota bacterium]
MSEYKARYWLNFDEQHCGKPLVYELSKRFDIVFIIRQASVNHEVGVIGMELAGAREVIKQAVVWLEKQGVKVEPVEIQTIEG